MSWLIFIFAHIMILVSLYTICSGLSKIVFREPKLIENTMMVILGIVVFVYYVNYAFYNLW